jgi:hypothetical protein
MDEQTRPDEQPTIEAAALPGENPDGLREQARKLHEEADARARAAAELRDAAAVLRAEAAALTGLADAEQPGEAPVGDLPAVEDPVPRRRWFRPRG